MIRVACCVCLLTLVNQRPANADDLAEPGSRPNVLWITSEDNSFQWLGCYGNEEAQTPRLDALAEAGVLFTHAYSNAPVCAVARSTILNGAYAVTQGTQHMRSRHRVPPSYRPYVAYLRERGYYCTNNSKTDYNQAGRDQAHWDACSNSAHYKHRPAGQPFFAVFNLTVCHESSLFPTRVAANRQRGIIPSVPRVDPATLALPPYLPDLPEIRSDFAIYHDNVTALDTQVGALLDELEQLQLADDTIVFYYADHGGPTPRGKRYLADTGVRIPMLVHVPEKWQHLAPFAAGDRVDELVSFVDLAPTLLSVCGIEQPAQMQGRAFLGTRRTEPPADPIVFLYADRFDEIIGMRRGITDGHFKYIRRFTPHLPAAPCSYYSLSMPAWIGWQRAWREGTLSPAHSALWETQPVEMLYDTRADPWEVANLADDPAHSDRLLRMRARLRQQMVAVYDTGVVPEALFDDLIGDGMIHTYVRREKFKYGPTLEMAFVASDRDAKNLPALTQALADTSSVIRYWGALGCVILGKTAAPAKSELESLLADSHAAVRITAARALAEFSADGAGRDALLAELNKPLGNDAMLLVVNAITEIDAENAVPQSWVQRRLREKSGGQYVQRFAQRLRDERQE